MACTVDHLGLHRRVRVRREFHDARGSLHHAGESAVIRHLDLDWPAQEITLVWNRNGSEETLIFRLDAREGPRSGHMREYFDVEGLELPPRPPPQRPEPPPLSASELATPVEDPARYGDGLARIAALAARGRYPEAAQQIRLLLAAPDPYGGVLEQLAEDLTGQAVAFAADPAVYAWAREQALWLWHAWGSGATSGGEGAVRGERIAAARERLDEAITPRSR